MKMLYIVDHLYNRLRILYDNLYTPFEDFKFFQSELLVSFFLNI